MQINSINTQTFNGIRFATIKQKDIINKQADVWIKDAKSRIQLSEKIKKCIDSKIVDIRINNNNEVNVIDKIHNTLVKVEHADDNLAKKFLKAVNLVLKA